MKRWFITGVLLLWPLFSAAGQQVTQVGSKGKQDSLLTIYKFEEIVVYGDRYIKEPGMTTHMSETGIRRRNSLNAAEVLRIDPALTITSGTKGGTQTRIRGFNARDVLVLVDGRPINPGYYGKADLAMLPAENIARVKIVKGPASVAYGPNSMGGVINIITRNGYLRPRTTLSAEFGADQFRKISLNHSRRIGRFNYWINGYEDKSRGFRLSENFTPTPGEDGGLRANSHYHKYGISAKIGLDPSSASSYAMTLDYHQAEKGAAPSASPLEVPMYREFPEWYRYGTSLNGRWMLSPRLEVTSTLFGDAYHDRFKSYRSSDMSDDNLEYDSRLENWTVGGSLDGTVYIGSSRSVRAGLHIRRDLMNKKPDSNEPWFSHHHLTASAFAEASGTVLKSTAATAGVGAHYFAAEENGSGVFHLSPMLSVSQRLPWNLQAAVSYANAVRFATMHQLYSQTSGNEALKPEEADKFELGLERSFLPGGWQGFVKAAVFYNSMKEMIYRAGRTFRYANIASASLPGWEFSTRWQYGTGLSADISYARIFASGASSELLEEVPEHRWGVQVFVETRFGLEVSYACNRSSSRSTYLDAVILGGYDTHTLSVMQHLGKGVTFKFRVSNMLDTNYQEELGYPAPGRQITGGFAWNIGG